MIVKVYTVFDKVAQEAGPLFQAKNDGVAYRMYEHMIKNEGINTKDYTLLKVCSYDTERIELSDIEVSEVVDITEDEE